MKKYLMCLISFFSVVFVILGTCEKVYALEEEETITITVDSNEDGSGFLYAIDSDAPEAFSESSTFKIAAGSSHIIYVKDAAGNITSQTYTHKVVDPDEEKELNIEVGVANQGDSSKYRYQENVNYEYMTDTRIDNSDANVIRKISTDGSDLAERVFYVITTEEGEEFYLVIEQGDSNKVHLLNTVTLDDLTALADGVSGKSKNKEPDNLLEALKNSGTGTEVSTPENENQTNTNVDNKINNDIYLYILIGIGVGAYYYFKIYKNKKNASMDVMDAMDMDEFSMEEDDEEEDLDLDEKEKQELLNQLINGEYEDEEELQDIQPDEYTEQMDKNNEYAEAYATSHKRVQEDLENSETVEDVDYLIEDIDESTLDEELDSEEDV